MNTSLTTQSKECNTFLSFLPKILQSVNSVNTQTLSRLATKARKVKPLSKLQYIILVLISKDCNIQEYCNRSIVEFSNLSGYTMEGVKRALKVLNAGGYIITKKQTRGRTSVRAVTRLGSAYSPSNFRRNNKSTPQSTPQTGDPPYKISYLKKEKENKDLLYRDSISEVTKREKECFDLLGFKHFDESIVLNRIKRSGLTLEQRSQLAHRVMAATYKKPLGEQITHPRAYFLQALENYRD